MAELKKSLEDLGYTNVLTYIASGNAIVQSDRTAAEVKQFVEEMLPQKFKLDSELIKVLVLTREQLAAVIKSRPKGFGDDPATYYCDAIFLMDIDIDAVMPLFNPREGVDQIWPGVGVVYSQRLGAERVKSRLNKIIGTPEYKSMTIRSWNTTTKLLQLLDEADAALKKK